MNKIYNVVIEENIREYKVIVSEELIEIQVGESSNQTGNIITGPQGPPGPKGDPGPKGEKGEKGSQVYENGQLQIFRKPGTPPDPDNKLPNVGDWCIGFVEGQFINATYLGGNPLLLTSYDI